MCESARCAQENPSPFRWPIGVGLKISSTIAMSRRSTCGEPRLFSSRPMGPAQTRSCDEPASPRLAFGAGRNASWKKGSRVCFATRPGPRGSSRSMARVSGLSVSPVQRIWRSHGLQPHRVRQFKLSNDPRFVDKLRDVVGLYVDPPAHAIVLSVDEKSQIQALDRTQPGLPLKKGRAGTMTH